MKKQIFDNKINNKKNDYYIITKNGDMYKPISDIQDIRGKLISFYISEYLNVVLTYDNIKRVIYEINKSRC